MIIKMPISVNSTSTNTCNYGTYSTQKHKAQAITIYVAYLP